MTMASCLKMCVWVDIGQISRSTKLFIVPTLLHDLLDFHNFIGIITEQHDNKNKQQG